MFGMKKKMDVLEGKVNLNINNIERLLKRADELENTLNEYKRNICDLFDELDKELEKTKRIIKYSKSDECTYNMVSGFDYGSAMKYAGYIGMAFVPFKNTLYIYNDGEEYSIELSELSKYKLKNDHIAEFITKHDGIVYVTIIPDDNSMYSFMIDYKNGKYVSAKTAVEEKETQNETNIV